MQRLIFGLALLASAARADVITQTCFIPDWWDLQSDWQGSIHLPFQQFNPALGVLTGVRYSAAADIGMYFANWPTGSPTYLTIQNTLYTSLGLAYRAFTYSDVSGSNPAPVNTTLNVTQSGTRTFNLDSFAGSDWWTLDVIGSGSVYAQSPSSTLPRGVISLHNLAVEIGYEYTPAVVSTPEPRYAGWLLIGMAIVACVARSRLLGRRASDSLELQ